MCTTAEVVAKIVRYSSTDAVIGGFAPQLASIAATRAEVEEILAFHVEETLECLCPGFWGASLCKAAALKAAYSAAEAYPAAAQGAGSGCGGAATGAPVTAIKEGDLAVNYAGAGSGGGTTALASSLLARIKALKRARGGGPRFILGGC